MVQRTIEQDTYTKFIQLGSTFSLHHHQTRILNPSARKLFWIAPPSRSDHSYFGYFRPKSLHGQLYLVAHLCQCCKLLWAFGSPIQHVELLWAPSLSQSMSPAAFTHTLVITNRNPRREIHLEGNAYGSRITHAEYKRKWVYNEWTTYE